MMQIVHFNDGTGKKYQPKVVRRRLARYRGGGAVECALMSNLLPRNEARVGFRQDWKMVSESSIPGRMTGRQEVDHLHGCVYPVSESPTTRGIDLLRDLHLECVARFFWEEPVTPVKPRTFLLLIILALATWSYSVAFPAYT